MQLYIDKYKNILSYLIADELTVTHDLCLWLLFGQEKATSSNQKSCKLNLKTKIFLSSLKMSWHTHILTRLHSGLSTINYWSNYKKIIQQISKDITFTNQSTKANNFVYTLL